MSLVTKDRQTEIINYLKKKRLNLTWGRLNTIIACNGLGIPSVLSGKIGNDQFGNIYLDQLKRHNVVSRVVQGNG